MFMILSDQVQGVVWSCITPTLGSTPSYSLSFSLRWCATLRGDSVSTPRKFHDDVISYFS